MEQLPAKKYLFIGYAFYGLGVSASFIGNASRVIIGFNVYEVLENFFKVIFHQE